MKRLVLFSILAVALRAQDEPQLQLIPPQKLLEYPSPVSPDSGKPAHTLELRGQLPSSLTLNFKVNPSGVCSVPLLEAQVRARDPGVAVSPGGDSVAIPQARVPAPTCATRNPLPNGRGSVAEPRP